MIGTRNTVAEGTVSFIKTESRYSGETGHQTTRKYESLHNTPSTARKQSG